MVSCISNEIISNTNLTSEAEKKILCFRRTAWVRFFRSPGRTNILASHFSILPLELLNVNPYKSLFIMHRGRYCLYIARTACQSILGKTSVY